MIEGNEAIISETLPTTPISKKFFIEVTPPLTDKEIEGLTPQVRSDSTLLRQEQCVYSLFQPAVDAITAASIDNNILQKLARPIEVPEPQDDQTLDQRMESYFNASRMRYESEAAEPNKDRSDAAWELELSKRYGTAASIMRSGIADQESTEILHKLLEELEYKISEKAPSSSRGPATVAKSEYLKRISSFYKSRFPLMDNKAGQPQGPRKATWTSVISRLVSKK